MVVIDATTLLLFFDPRAKGPPVPRAHKRVEHLISELDRTHTKVCIPSPVLSEVLVKRTQREWQDIIATIKKKAVFEVEPFDERAAIEMAEMLKVEIGVGGLKKLKAGPETWAKLKFDRQIVAIAKVVRASAIYSDDGDIRAVAGQVSIPVHGIADLPLPPDDDQTDLFDEEEDEPPPPEDDE